MDRSLHDLSLNDLTGDLPAKQRTVLQAVARFGARHPERAALLVPIMAALLEHQDPDIVALSSWALGQIGHERPCAVEDAIPVLQTLIHHPSSHVRQCVVWALGRIGEARPKLIEHTLPDILSLDQDPDPTVRLAMLWLCEAIVERHPEWLKGDIPRLGKLLSDPDIERVQRETFALIRALAASAPEDCQVLSPALKAHSRNTASGFRDEAYAILSLIQCDARDATPESQPPCNHNA